MKTYYKYIFFIFYVLIIVIIVLSSLKDASSSIKDSDAVTDVIIQVGGNTNAKKESISSFVRNIIGHFGSFFVCGIFGILSFCLIIKNRKMAILLCIVFGFVFSIIAEILQLIPEGRYCDIKDMITNFSGYLSSILICLFIHYLYQRKQKEKLLF